MSGLKYYLTNSPKVVSENIFQLTMAYTLLQAKDLYSHFWLNLKDYQRRNLRHFQQVFTMESMTSLKSQEIELRVDFGGRWILFPCVCHYTVTPMR